MDRNLRVLKLVLKELDCDESVQGGVGARKILQKAVYLAQVAAADLGYRYSWYRKGPYCSELADSYYEMDRQFKADSKALDGKKLVPSIAEKLGSIAPMIKAVPKGLDKELWLELLASYHFLRTVSNQDEEQAAITMQDKKPHLADYVELAEKTLQEFELLNK